MSHFCQNLDTINRLLGDLGDDADRAEKAYSLGLISALAEIDGVVAPDSILELAATCKTVKDAVSLYKSFRELRGSREEYA